MHSNRALVSFVWDEQWRGQLLAGEFPNKMVVIDRSFREHPPQGVPPPCDNVPYIVEIVRDSQPGSRHGVLFARPLQVATFGWMPIGEPVMGVRCHEWRCLEFPDARTPKACSPTQEPKENERFRQVRALHELFVQANSYELLALFGEPDTIQPADRHQVVLTWNDVGSRTFPLTDLIYGYRNTHRHAKIPVPSSLWAEVSQKWSIGYRGGLFLIDVGGVQKVRANFAFDRFPQVEFEFDVFALDTRKRLAQWMVHKETLTSAVRASVFDLLAPFLPTPEEQVEAIQTTYLTRCKAHADALARFTVPGQLTWTQGSQLRNVFASPKFMGERGPSEWTGRNEHVTVMHLAWGLVPEETSPGQNGCMATFGATVSREEAMASVGTQLRNVYASQLEDVRVQVDPVTYGYLEAVMSADEYREWFARYTELAEQLLRCLQVEVEDYLRQRIAERNAMVQLLARVTAHQPPAVSVSTTHESETTSTVVAAEPEPEAFVNVTWYLSGIESEEVTRLTGLASGRGVAPLREGDRIQPGDHPLVAVRVYRNGGKRHTVAVVDCAGVEVLYEHFDGRMNGGALTFVARIAADNWKVVWQHYRDGIPEGTSHFLSGSAVVQNLGRVQSDKRQPTEQDLERMRRSDRW